MKYTLYNTAEQADRAISGAYEALVVLGTGLARLVDAPLSGASFGVYPYHFAVSGTTFYAATGQNQWGRLTLSSW
jgi:hypothetical protein